MNRPFCPPVRRFFVALVFVLAGLSLLFGAASSARASSEARTVFTNSLKKMPVSAGKAVAAVTASADAAASVEFQVSLKMRDYPKLLDRLAKGERPTQAEMAARYYPLAADVAKVSDWAASQGLTVVSTEPNHLGVQLRGTVAQVQTALRTTFSRVSFEGAEYTAAQTAPSLPGSVAAGVLGINGLQPYLHATKHRLRTASAQPVPEIANQPPYYVKEILHAYDADTTGFNGANQKIAILIDTFPLDTDLTKFWQANSIPQVLTNIEKINVTNAATLPAPTGEETLDVSWSSGVARARRSASTPRATSPSPISTRGSSGSSPTCPTNPRSSSFPSASGKANCTCPTARSRPSRSTLRRSPASGSASSSPRGTPVPCPTRAARTRTPVPSRLLSARPIPT